MFADNSVGVSEEIIARAGVGVKDHVGENYGIISDRHMVANDSIGADVGVGSNMGCRCDRGGGVNPWSVGRSRVKELYGVGKSEVRIIYT